MRWPRKKTRKADFLEQAQAFAKGDLVRNPHPAIVLFMRAKAMKWSHLPVAGGMYDQDPMLFHYWSIIWAEEAEVARKEQEKRDHEMKQRKASTPSRRGGRGRVAGR